MEVEYNPWNVLSLEEFHFYNCPECESKYAIKEQFIGHAIFRHPKACETLPGIIHEQKSVAVSNVKSLVEPESCDNLVISKVQSVPDEEQESCDDERVESMSNGEFDENCDISDIELSSKASGCDDEKSGMNADLESIICIEKVEPMSDTENDVNCDNSDIESTTKTSDHEDVEEDLSEYEKLRLKNIADRQAQFNGLKIRDKVLDLSKNKKSASKDEKKRKQKKHDMLVMDPLTKKFKCKQCKRDFSSKPYLIEHVQSVHEGVPFKCDQCSKTYTSSNGLHLHIGSVHARVKRFKCKQCEKVFCSQYDLNKHLQNVHEGFTFKCDQCSKTFTSKQHLHLHIQPKCSQRCEV